MTDLTEQWKKGELENNWYYVRTTNGIEKWEYIKQSHGFGYYETEWVLEILAKVPSYDEWQRILHYAGKYEVEYTSCVMDYENLKEENTKLKELLKEWARFETEENPNDFTVISERMSELANKTNQALGKDK